MAVITAHACPHSEIGAGENGGMSVYVREMAAGPQGPISKDAFFYHLPEFYRGVAQWARDDGTEFRLIHSHYWLSGWAGRRLSQLWGVPWAHMAHTLARVKDRDRPAGAAPEADQRVAVELEIVRSTNRMMAPTNQEVEDLVFLYGADRSCISVVPPGVDTDLFTPTDGADLRRRLGITDAEKVILFIGRLERLKGVEILLHSLAAVLEARTERDVRLVVLGAPGYYSMADVCAVPSYSESFGLVALEAEACGTPVVASRIGGLRQLVLDGITGITVPSHEPMAWAESLRRVIDDPDAAAVMGPAARRLARSYSWAASADLLLQAYEETEVNYRRAAQAVLG